MTPQQTFTQTFTGREGAQTFTTPSRATRNRMIRAQQTFTQTFTTFTRQDLHVFAPLLKRGERESRGFCAQLERWFAGA